LSVSKSSAERNGELVEAHNEKLRQSISGGDVLSYSDEPRTPSAGSKKKQMASGRNTLNPMLQDEDDASDGIVGPAHIVNPMLAHLNDAEHTPMKKAGKKKASKKKNHKREKATKNQEHVAVSNPMFEEFEEAGDSD
jgi:hypothetical protein